MPMASPVWPLSGPPSPHYPQPICTNTTSYSLIYDHNFMSYPSPPMVTRSQSSRPKLSKWMEDGRPHSSFFFFYRRNGCQRFSCGSLREAGRLGAGARHLKKQTAACIIICFVPTAAPGTRIEKPAIQHQSPGDPSALIGHCRLGYPVGHSGHSIPVLQAKLCRLSCKSRPRQK